MASVNEEVAALLHGTELNVAPDGSVDWDEDFLSGFDITVASVQTENPNPKHSGLPRGQRWGVVGCRSPAP